MNAISTNVIKIIDIPEVPLTGKYKIIDEKIIAHIEKKIRSSYEYRSFIDYLKHTLDINRCSFYEGYSMANGFKIEIHHAPLTLFDYTYVVCAKQMQENDGYFYDLDVAEEVTRLHFMFKVGLVPLNPTAHELVHSGNLDIHPDLIIGDYNAFVTEYNEFISESIKNKLIKLEEVSKTPKGIPAILNQNKITLQTPYQRISKSNIESVVHDKLKALEKLN